MSMSVGSLFSGIGGLDLGFERAGFTIAWQVEIDPYCRRVLAKHWPSVPCYEDIREVGAHNLAPVDVLVGGFPCQDISNAGKRAGITGSRSGLWGEYARLVRELRPRYVVVENVAALLHRGIDIVLGDLASCLYDADGEVLPAAAFGAPHRRDRLFIVAHTTKHGWGEGQAGRPIGDGADGKDEQTGTVAYSAGSSEAKQPVITDSEALVGPGIRAGRGIGGGYPTEGVLDDRRTAPGGASPLADTERIRTQVQTTGQLTTITGVGGNGTSNDVPDTHNNGCDTPGNPQTGLGGATWGATRAPSEQRANKRSRVGQEVWGGGVFTEYPGRQAAWWATEPDVGRVAHGVPARVDRLRALGNAVVPQVAQYVAECIREHAEGY